MKEKILYYIISILINILICVGGAWTILIGMLCMFGFIFSSPSTEDFIIGILFYIGTYVVAFLANLIVYKLFKKRHSLTFRYFLIPTIVVSAFGLIYTLLLLR